MKIKVIALMDHEYASRPRKTGEVYEADERFLKTLITRKRVRVFEETTEAPIGRTYKRRDMKAEK